MSHHVGICLLHNGVLLKGSSKCSLIKRTADNKALKMQDTCCPKTKVNLLGTHYSLKPLGFLHTVVSSLVLLLLSRREVYKLIYGPSSIYARTANKADVKSITTADMKQFMTEWQRPDSAVLGLVGDFQADTAMEAVRQVFGSWHVADGQPAAPLPPPKANIPDQGNAGVVFLIDRPGASQVSVLLQLYVSHPFSFPGCVFTGEPGSSATANTPN